MNKNENNISEIKARFAVWNIGEEEYKLKLRTQDIVMLEGKLGGNLMIFLGKMSDNSMPTLAEMSMIVLYARKAYDKNVTIEKVYRMFDEYFDNGGTQAEFIAGPFMDLFKVSGFFSKKMEAQIEESQAKVQEII